MPQNTPVYWSIVDARVVCWGDPHTFHVIVPTESERAKRDEMKSVGVDE